MGDEPALLAAILTHPDEDTPRLMYADWLDEHGQPERAEFIRLQCAPEYDDSSEGRAFELEERNRAKWLAGLPSFPTARWEFRRGFPDHLDAYGPLFLERFDAFARVPWLRFLSLHHLDGPAVRGVIAREWPTQWVELALVEDEVATGATIGTSAIAAVAHCPQVRQLRSLLLSLHRITGYSVRELAGSPYLENVERLHIEAPGDDRFAPLRERFGERLVIG